MTLQAAAQELFDACRAVDEEIEVCIDVNEITLYWHNLRMDIQPKEFTKALNVIKTLKNLGARFE